MAPSGHNTQPWNAEGNELPGSIAVLESVELGGMEQWILIRGADRSNPVLLWLHGGPGGAQMPFAHHTDRELERHFVVVHWDQRGAGKSNHRGFDERTMQLERYAQDALELIEYLRARLEVETLVLLGHSWGTRIGMHLVDRHHQYFDAYIGVGQAVNHERAAVFLTAGQTKREPGKPPVSVHALPGLLAFRPRRCERACPERRAETRIAEIREAV